MCEITDIRLHANKPHFQDNKYSLSPCYNFLETFGEVIWTIDTVRLLRLSIKQYLPEGYLHPNHHSQN